MGSSEDALYFQTRYNGFAVGHYLRYPLVSRDLNGFKYGHLCVYTLEESLAICRRGYYALLFSIRRVISIWSVLRQMVLRVGD